MTERQLTLKEITETQKSLNFLKNHPSVSLDTLKVVAHKLKELELEVLSSLQKPN